MTIYLICLNKYNFPITVFEIVLRVCEGVPWRDALLQVLPTRKGAHVCDTTSNVSSNDVSYESDI